MKKMTLLLIAHTIVAVCFAQELKFDLAETPGSLPAINQKITKVILQNAFPWRAYSVAISEEVVIQPPLSIGGGSSASESECKEFLKLFDKVKDYVYKPGENKTEKGLKDTLKMIEMVFSSLKCDDSELQNKIKVMKEDCVRELTLTNPVTMTTSNNYTITVAGTKKEYKFKYLGKTKGRWLLNYGFLFTSKKLEPDNYFLDKVGNDSFRITTKTPHSIIDLRFTPTIFFNYILDKKLDNTWTNSLTGGIGFNTESPVVGLGYNLMYQQNIGFSIGFVFFEQQRLNGKYKIDQILKENLDDNQLHEKTFFRPNIFLAINLRLGESPFKKAEKEEVAK